MGIPGLAQQARLGRYELLARLATGGMGEIFLARLEGAAGFERLFVIKRILPHLADDARFRQMLIAEARIASKLSHGNICQVFELGETDGQLYLVMEYLDGVTLLPLLRRASKQHAPLDLGFVAGVVQQTTDALHYAHELVERGEALGIVHRDVSPSNIFLTEAGIVKVLDFGIAKAKGASTNTQEGTVKGKYAYMAPEQLRGTAIDRRVDVFALAIVVFEMLALRRLFQRKTDYLTFRAVMEQPIPDVRRYRPDVPEALAQALARALDRDPDVRFDTARALGSALIDAVGKRPWTQGEISDFVRASFAEQIGRRSHQVQAVVQRTASGGLSPRVTMPLIAHDSEAHEDDEEFLPVETDVDPAPAFAPAGPPAASQSGDFVGGTPPPFAVETTDSGPKLEPVRAASPAAAAPRRSLAWPLLAIGAVAIAGGALFLVWQQMQRQPTSVVIQQGHDDHGSADPAIADPDTLPTHVMTPGSAAGDPSPVPPVHPHRVRSDPYTAAIEAKLPALNKCLSDHAETALPGSGGHATILIGGDGKPKTVALEPASLEATALGACLRATLMAIGFPAAHDDKRITVPFKPKSS
ncbi:MAG TPA: serine/threonine-protein kinase [Kofleriaceae bacterium]|nr:serine/threonine-protein kinase [Kofleriaceae bacterium]